MKTEKKISPSKRRESRSSSSSSSSGIEESSSAEKIIQVKKETAPVSHQGSPQVSSISSRLGPAVSIDSKEEVKVSAVSSRLGPVVSEDSSRGQSAFSRLGSQQGEASKPPSKNVYSRLGPEETESHPQESRISSTSETSPGKAGDIKTKGNQQSVKLDQKITESLKQESLKSVEWVMGCPGASRPRM